MKTFADVLNKLESIKTQEEFDTFIKDYKAETNLTYKVIKQNMWVCYMHVHSVGDFIRNSTIL
jgi:hypothetical protein